MPRGRGNLTRAPPDIDVRVPRKPNKGPNTPEMTKPTKPTKPKPPTTKPTKPTKPNAPTKPSMIGNVGSGLATGALFVGGSSLLTGGMGGGMGGGLGGMLGLAGQGIQTAGAVSVANTAIDAVKDVVNDITQDPVNLAIVAAAIGGVLYLSMKK